MKKAFDWRLWINLIPALLQIVLFRIGAMFTFTVFPILLLVFLIVNSRTAKTVTCLWAQQSVMAAALVVSGGVSTRLYFSWISNDAMTPFAGILFAFLNASIVLSATALAVPYVVRKKRQQSKPETAPPVPPTNVVCSENLFLNPPPKPIRDKVKNAVLVALGILSAVAVWLALMLFPARILEDTYYRVIVPSGRYIAYDELHTCPIDISTETALYSWFDEYIDDDMLIELRRYMRENELYIQPGDYLMARIKHFDDLKSRLRFIAAEDLPQEQARIQP